MHIICERVTRCICFLSLFIEKINRNCIEQASCSDYGVSSTISKDKDVVYGVVLPFWLWVIFCAAVVLLPSLLQILFWCMLGVINLMYKFSFCCLFLNFLYGFSCFKKFYSFIWGKKKLDIFLPYTTFIHIDKNEIHF